MKGNGCALQFTGGRDSTLTAIRLVEDYRFDSIHLLTFKTDLMSDLNKVFVNIKRLKGHLKNQANFVYKLLNVQDLLHALYQEKYLRNLLSYGTLQVATFCFACRLSHHAHSIIYCMNKGIKYAADGVNKLTGFDLFQQPWAVKKVRRLYERFNISYITPIFESEVSSEQQLELISQELNLKNPFVESQPRCLGGGQYHNLYLRCHYLPMKGKESYIEMSSKWIDDKIKMVIEHIKAHTTA